MTGGARWLFGFVGTWFVLSAMADIESTRDLAAALALGIAATATVVMGPKAAATITGRNA